MLWEEGMVQEANAQPEMTGIAGKREGITAGIS
jgi:hypothetical protein